MIMMQFLNKFPKALKSIEQNMTFGTLNKL